ncbi:hypothetical protein ABZ464_49815 [Streptomyces sp. NPDC005820]|uniref:hypothetical protein n=1 Tax=Streptomyces sp. NPDC005820 TaxID=3157069 RepID=UPI0033EEE248
MRWTDWPASFVAQVAVVRISATTFFRDALSALGCLERLLCYSLGIGLAVTDGLVLAAVVGPSRPIQVRTSVQLFGLVLIARLLNEANHQATKPRAYVRHAPDVDSEDVARGRVALCMFGVGLLVVAEARVHDAW